MMSHWLLTDDTMHTFHAAFLALVLSLAGCAAAPSAASLNDIRQEVVATERAFARTMADRDLAAFASFLSDEAIFYSGPTPLRGKENIVAAWTRFYAGPTAPFSWEPQEVEVLDSGTLAISSGPVLDAAGNMVATFTSIWRRERTGPWRIVFDKGAKACDCAMAQQ